MTNSKLTVAAAVAAALLQQHPAVAGTINTNLTITRSPSIPVAPVAPGPVTVFSYHVQILPMDSANDMNDGIIVGTANGEAVVDINGEVTPLPGKAGYTDITPTAVSSNGFIVGTGTSGANTCGLFWSSYTSAPVAMGCLGPLTKPESVNDQGLAVGAYYPESTGLASSPTAFAWSAAGGIRSIAPRYSDQSEARSITDSGYVAGVAWYAGEEAATRWFPGSFAAGTAGYSDFGWRAMEDGTIYSQITSWDLSNHAQIIVPNSNSRVFDINTSGRKIGEVYTAPNRAWTTAVNSNSEVILPAPAGFTTTFPLRVNGCGSILGVVFAGSTQKPVLWTKTMCDGALVAAPIAPISALQ